MVEDEAPPAHAPGARDLKEVAGDDFLFHLYRGSELLQDNRVHEAKQELEQAISLQPRDSKGQDLLAIVYFRLGLYPRAISIYESLITMYPHSATPRVNVALCYLKTGQAASARAELERVLELNPRHSRAWGYLGLAFQRLGDYERAYQAFVTGGHEVMARRLMEMVGISPRELDRAPRAELERDLVGQAATQAFDQIEATDGVRSSRSPLSDPGPFRADEGVAQGSSTSGTWSAVEPGRDAPYESVSRGLSPSLLPSLAPSESLLPPVMPRGETTMTLNFPMAAPIAHVEAEADAVGHKTDFRPPPLSVRPEEPVPSERIPSIVPHLEPPEKPEVFARKILLVFPRLHRAAQHPSGLVVMKVSDTAGVRFDMVRAMSFPAGMQSKMLSRRQRGRELEEPLGGVASPLFEIAGSGEIVLGPNVGTKLQVVTTTGEPLFVRESILAALDGSVIYESGRLAGSDGDSVPMVQLRASMLGDDAPVTSAVVVLSLPPSVASIEVADNKAVLLRAHAVLGWTGRVTPRNLPPSEAPGKSRGFVSLSGEGMVIVDGR